MFDKRIVITWELQVFTDFPHEVYYTWSILYCNTVLYSTYVNSVDINHSEDITICVEVYFVSRPFYIVLKLDLTSAFVVFKV